MEHNMHGPLRIKKLKNEKFTVKFYNILLIPYLLFIIMLILMPVIFILMYSMLRGDAFGMVQGIDLTLENFIQVIQSSGFMRNLFNSLRLAMIATIIAIFIAYPLAYWISRRKQSTQAALILLVTAPMWLNMILRLLALRQLFEGLFLTILGWFGFSGQIIGSNFAIIFAMVYIYIPFMILPIYAFLSKMDKRFIEASRDLGASRAQTFKKVILPLSIPGVLSGVTIVLLGSISTVVIPQFVGGNTWLIGTVIEFYFMQGGRASWFVGSAAGIILLAIVFTVMWLINKLDRRKGLV